jgi:hypothetical protein
MQQWWVYPLIIWELVWKGYGLWFSARNNQRNWFMAMLVVNSLGILPIVYLKFFQPKKNEARENKSHKTK